jgi:hypothetical protein
MTESTGRDLRLVSAWTAGSTKLMRNRPHVSQTSRAIPAVIVVIVSLCIQGTMFRLNLNLPPNRNPVSSN